MDIERDFQIFVKPVGPVCDLACRYCYYSGKPAAAGEGTPLRMEDGLLESYIAQHIAAATDEIIRFSWHGGEPTLAGLDFYRRAVAIQKSLRPDGRTIRNGLQTNGARLDGDWGRFLAEEGFSVGVSLDGPARFHDAYRVGRDGRPSHARALRGYEILRRYGVATDVLCVVHSQNAGHSAEVYGFFKSIGASFVTFLPLVERDPGVPGGTTPESVPAQAWGTFLRSVFDEWTTADIGRLKVQIFEEAARTAFGQDHSLCLFRPVCGGIPVVEKNGDFYPCDHYVRPERRLGNIRETPLVELIDSPLRRAFGAAKRETLPRVCRECPVLAMCNGECPKNRFLTAPDGEPGLNYLCAGYKAFFLHARPFVEAVAAAWKRGRAAGESVPGSGTGTSMPPNPSRIPGRRNRRRPIRS